MDGAKVEKTPLIEKKKEERDESTCVMHIIKAWALLYLKELYEAPLWTKVKSTA